MNNEKILKKLEEKIGIPGISNQINDNLSGSELNSFLLELFNLRIKKIKPAGLVNQYQHNRFCLPSSLDIIKFKELELSLLNNSINKGFYPIELSPLTPLGTCSAVAYVDQNNIVSAIRGTEVVSDIANVLALKTGCDIKTGNSKYPLKYCTVHRHVRGQSFTNPAFSAHFGIFCMTSGGADKGSFSFETEELIDHINFYYEVLIKTFEQKDILLKILFDENNPGLNNKLKLDIEDFSEKTGLKVEYCEKNNEYYNNVQFKYFLNYKNELINLADGGSVDWLQKLLENKKLRFVISGLGTELTYKIIHKVI